ncbi:MAG: hypothetical protein FJ009_09375 [Chloroflexi bacterium]|nr:hypothetical protein [Chloroflexota bacterium]
MDTARFTQVENEYFRLKGLFSAGRMNRQEFEQALKPLVIQDEQGRRWMLGIDDARWYVHNGNTWVLADPSGGALPGGTTAVAPPAPPRHDTPFALIGIASGVFLLCLCAAVGIFFAATQGLIKIGPQRPPTLFIIPTPFIYPTPYIAPLPTYPPAPIISPLPVAPSTTTLAPTATLTPTPTATPTLTPTATLTPTLARPQGNCADPNARWENVTDGQTIDPYQAFIGTATHENFAGYVVEWIRPGNVLHRATTPVTRGVIFVWNTYTVANGVYPIALTVVLNDGTTLAPCVITVRVAH